MKHSDIQLRRNIYIYYFLQLADFMSFFGAISTYYFLDLGFSLFQITIFVAVTALTKIIFEIPSGIISDKYGRKIGMLMYSTSFFLMTIILLLTSNYWILILSALFRGLKVSFKSGTDNSLLYDTLKDLKEEDQFKHIISKGGFLYFAGMTFAFLIGPLVSKYISFSTMLTINIIPALITIFLTLLIKEPNFIKSAKSSKLHFTDCMKTIFSKRKLLYLILTIAFTRALILSSFEFIQVFFKNASLDLALYGIIYSIWTIFSSLASLFYSKIKEKFSDTHIFDSILFLFAVSLIILGFTENIVFVLIGYTLIELIAGIFFPLHNHFIHKELQSSERSTIYSIMSQINGISVIILTVTAGIVATLFDVNTAILTLSAFGILTVGLSYIKLRRIL